MNTARVSLCLAIMLAWPLTTSLLAQQYSPPPGRTALGDFPSEDAPEVDDIHTQSLFDNRNYMLRSDAGDGVGYLRGFQTFAAFQPIMVDDNFILWTSPRGYVTYNSGSFGGNLGGGARWLDPSTQRILGAGFWWDHDNNGINQYDQLGGGVEWLGNYFDLRGNVYFPTTNHPNLVTKFVNPSAIFVGHNIDIVSTSIFNAPLTGGDFEGGGALPGIGDLGMRAYAGGYYYQGPVSGGAVYGVRGRLEALITQNLWGTVAVTHDRVFGTNVTAAATIYLGTGQEPRWFQRIPMETRLFQQMERQYRVAVQQQVVNDFQVALRAGGTGGSGGPVGTPIFVDHVNNTAPAGGDGSVEHPFNQLPTTTPTNVDIIFVNRGDGTSNGMNQGITLNNFQRLLGQGVMHTFTALQGTFVLPGYSPGPLPTITNVNAGGDAVTLASNNEVSGFNIVGSKRYGIFGSGITNFNINNVNITTSGTTTPTPIGDGIHIENAVGTGLITASTFSSNIVNGVQIASTLDFSAAALNLTVDSDRFSQNGANGLEIANNGPSVGGQTINATVTASTFSNNTGMGVRVDDKNAFTNLTVGGITPAQGNTFTANGSAGVGYFTSGTPTPFTTPSLVNILNNTFTGTLAGTDPLAHGDAIFFSLRGGQLVPAINPRNVDVNIANNTITTSARDGIHMEIRDLVFLPTFDINSNIINTNVGSGINILTTNATSTTPRIPNGQMNNNIVTLNGGDGVTFTAQADTVDVWSLNANQFNQNTGSGLSVATSQNSVFVLNSLGDQFVSNGQNGVQVSSTDSSSVGTLLGNPAINGGVPTPISFTNDTITNNSSNGMAFTSSSLSTFFAQVQGTTIQNNTLNGMNVTTNDSSTMSVNVGGTGVGQGNLIANNKANGAVLNTNSQSSLTVDFESNTISSNAGDGVQGNHGGGTISNAQVVFGTFLPFTPGSTINATFHNNLVTLNGGRGFNVSFTGLAGGNYTMTNNTINANGQEGVFLQTNSGLRTNTFVDVTENSYNSGLFTPPPSTILSDGFGNSISWVDPTVLNNVVLVATDNTIRNNGADGMFLKVATTGYVHADVQRNNFGGNFLNDFRTASVLASDNTGPLETLPDVVLTARASGTTLEQRQIFLDNVARLDLRFTGNGYTPLPPADSMATATAFGATYSANSVKNGIGATTDPATHGDIFFTRNAGFFRVENNGGAGGTIDTFNVFQEDLNNGLTPFGILTNPITGGYGVVPTGTFTPPLPALVIP